MSEDECSAMMQHPVPVTEHEDCPMPEMSGPSDDHKAVIVHDFGFACACSIDQASVTTESMVIQKQKISVPVLPQKVSNLNPDLKDRSVPMTGIRQIISPPPLYLMNATFLN